MMTFAQLESMIPELKALGAKPDAVILIDNGAGRMGLKQMPVKIEGQDQAASVAANGHWVGAVVQPEAVVFTVEASS